MTAPPGFEHHLQAQPQQNTRFEEYLTRAHHAQAARHGDACSNSPGQPGPGLRELPAQTAQRAEVGAGLAEAHAPQPAYASAAKAKLQEKLAAHQEVGPVMCAPVCSCCKPMPKCSALQSPLLVIPMLLHIASLRRVLKMTGDSHMRRQQCPLSLYKAHCLRHLYAVMRQAEGARGRGCGRGRGRRRRFHEDEEEAGMTLEEWEAQQGGHQMFCLALVRKFA